jgi:1-acyl-sn-glycerol-3-phosphate acyltransferase
MLAFICIFSFIGLFFLKTKNKKMRVMAEAIRIFSVIASFIFGLRIKITGARYPQRKNGLFLVANHVSYVDGIIASKLFPLLFIARGDLKNWPFFGLFSRVSKTIFINRLTPYGLNKEIAGISSVLKDGINVMLFPEGTTTDGFTDINFKSSFFQAAVLSGSQVLPFTIKYTKINGQHLNDQNKDLLFWYGDTKFFNHLLKLLELKSIEADINILEPINVSGIDRKLLSRLSQEAIVSNLVRMNQSIIRRHQSSEVRRQKTEKF